MEHFKNTEEILNRLKTLPIPDVIVANTDMEAEAKTLLSWVEAQPHLYNTTVILVEEYGLNVETIFSNEIFHYKEVDDLIPLLHEKAKTRARERLYTFGPDSVLYSDYNNKQIIIVIDREPLISQMIKRSINRELPDYEVVLLSKPEAVIGFIKSINTVRLVISGEMLASMAGTRLAKIIKETNPNTQFILCTGFPLDYVDEKAAKNGVDYLLSKPFLPKSLMDIVQDALNL